MEIGDDWELLPIPLLFEVSSLLVLHEGRIDLEATDCCADRPEANKLPVAGGVFFVRSTS